jgi:hypothetical protein
MTINELIKNFQSKKIMNSKANPNAVSEYIAKELAIKKYIPFIEKRKIAEMIVHQNIQEVDGIKKYDSINGYLGLMVASISAHTNLEWGADPISEYDLLAESGLLPYIIMEFQVSHEEIDLLRKMALEMELEDNCTNALVGRFLNKISALLDVVQDQLKGFDLQSIFGADIKKEDLAKLIGLLDKIK